jgi:flagellar biogenesis protein FliO
VEKKRIGLVGILALLTCCGAVFISKTEGNNSSNAIPQKWSLSDANLPLQGAHTTGDTLRRLTLSVVAVIVIGGIALYASKKWIPKLTCVRGKKVQVLETVQLAPHKAIHLIGVGTQKFLIGSSSESVRMLADVTLALAEEELSKQDKHAEEQK